MLTTPMITRAFAPAKIKPTPSETPSAHSASPDAAPASTARPDNNAPDEERRAISALIGPGGHATDQPSRKPAAIREA